MIQEFKGEYAFLSNFFQSDVDYKGLKYHNNESAFQAQKTTAEAERMKFTELNPTEAKKLGRKIPLRKDWEQIKVKVMREIVYAKFSQNEDLKEKLLATNDEILIEGNTWGDRIWGAVNGQGQNLLGQILMQIRADFQQEREDKTMSKYKIECEYSDGSTHTETDFKDLEDLQKSADTYRYLYEKQEKLKSNGQTIDMYCVYYDGMMIECNGEFTRNF